MLLATAILNGGPVERLSACTGAYNVTAVPAALERVRCHTGDWEPSASFCVSRANASTLRVLGVALFGRSEREFEAEFLAGNPGSVFGLSPVTWITARDTELLQRGGLVCPTQPRPPQAIECQPLPGDPCEKAFCAPGAPNAATANTSGTEEGLDGNAVSAIVLGAVVALSALITVVFVVASRCCCRRCRKAEEALQAESPLASQPYSEA